MFAMFFLIHSIVDLLFRRHLVDILSALLPTLIFRRALLWNGNHEMRYCVQNKKSSIDKLVLSLSIILWGSIQLLTNLTPASVTQHGGREALGGHPLRPPLLPRSSAPFQSKKINKNGLKSKQLRTVLKSLEGCTINFNLTNTRTELLRLYCRSKR